MNTRIIAGWEKEISQHERSNILGPIFYELKYFDQSSQQTFTTTIFHDNIKLSLSAENTELSKYQKLLEILEVKRDWRGCASVGRSITRQISAIYPPHDFESIKDAIVIIALSTKIPQEVVEDILLEIEDRINERKNLMVKLTEELILRNETITIRILNTAHEMYSSAMYVKYFIKQLVENKKFYDAIVWCQIFNKIYCFYKEINVIGLEAGLQLQLQIKYSNVIDKEVTFPSDPSLSLQEHVFKFAWNVAELSGPDISVALRYLHVLSGRSGLERIYCNEPTRVDGLIKLARMNKEVMEENKRLIKEIKQLKTEQAKVSSAGMFNHSFEPKEVIVPRKRQRAMSV